MDSVMLPAHFEGHQTVLSSELNEERADWARLGRHNLAAAYGDNEPEYTTDDIKEWNPTFLPDTAFGLSSASVHAICLTG